VTGKRDPKLEKLAQWYAEYKVEGRPGWSADYQFKRRRIDRMLAIPGVPQHGRFLELGCGAGNVTLYAAEKGFEAYGIDATLDAIEWARENERRSAVTADFRLGSVAELESYPADFFDIIYDGDCLFMVLSPDRPTCFRNIYRVAKLGGFFRARAHLAKPHVTGRCHIQSDRYYDPETRRVVVDGVPIYQYSTHDGFVGEIEESGFRVTNVYVCGPHPPDHPALAGFMWADATKRR